MTRFKNFIRTSVFGGVVVLLPAVVLFLVFRWLYRSLTNMFGPVSALIVEKTSLQPMLTDMLVLFMLLLVCFMIGMFVKTQMGNLIVRGFENATLRHAPGYTIIKETVMLFFGRNKTPFSSVALVKPFSSDTMMTAFITDEHPDGSFTVFIPTAPNPTSGNIYHMPTERVFIIDVPVEEALRTILSCGIGSTNMIQKAAEVRNQNELKKVTYNKAMDGPDQADK
ncbi:DUF502 domain-containing protein [Balneolaceae bacterium ANBcel3]|nr:DUF502 domain-containing protein [Balneolaceae bacterium ANBcel3]